jgi:hypothetical protein
MTAGTVTNVSTFANIAGANDKAAFKAYTTTPPVVSKSAMSLVSSVALALGALALFQ